MNVVGWMKEWREEEPVLAKICKWREGKNGGGDLGLRNFAGAL